MGDSTFEALMILFAAVLPCGISGYLIAFKGYRGLISGYREGDFAQPQAFGKSIGISLIIFATLLAVIAYMWYLQLFADNQLSNTVLVLVFFVLVNYYRSLVKYKNKPKA